MKKLLIVMSVFLLIGFVNAVSTDVYVKTSPWANVQISASDASSASYTLLVSDKKLANEYGDAYFNIDLDKKFNLYVFIKDGTDNLLVSERFNEAYSPGEKVEIELIPSGHKKVETPSAPETEEVLEEAFETSEEVVSSESVEPGWKKITGNVVSTVKSVDTNYYLLAGVLVFAFVGLFFMKKRKVKANKNEPSDEEDKEIKVRKMSEYLAEKRAQKKNDESKDIAVAELESKIKTLQGELEKLRSSPSEKQRKIEEAKQKLIKDQEELMRLRKGED